MALILPLKAVEISIIGVQIKNTSNIIFLFEADTRSSDQSVAKITGIKRTAINTPPNDMIDILMFWDDNTKNFPFDLFFNFPSVKVLHITKPNQDMDSPINGNFFNAKKLENLLITSQNFNAMGSYVFEGTDVLYWLYLEDNRISSVDEKTFINLKNLKEFSLQSNLLRSFPNETFSPLLELEVLNLRNNLITFLPPALFANNKKLKTILFDANRLLFVQDLILPAESYEKFEFTDNLCVNEVYYDPAELNKAMENDCTIMISPGEILEAYKRQLANPNKCDMHDRDRILMLQEKIKTVENDIQNLKENNLRLTEILEKTEALNACQSPTEYEL